MGGKFGGGGEGVERLLVARFVFSPGLTSPEQGTLAVMRLGLPPNSGDTTPNSAKVGFWVSLELACRRACTQ